MNYTERILRGVLHRDDPAWERWLKYEILANQGKIMKAIESLEKAVARVTAAAEGLHKEHSECPTHDEVQEAADALHRLADKLENRTAAAAAPPAT